MSRTPFRIFFVERPLNQALPEIVAGFAAVAYRATANSLNHALDALNRRRTRYQLEEIPHNLRRDIGLRQTE